MGNSHGRFVWYELMTTDMKTAKLFYANVVGWGAREASAPALGYSLFTVADLPVAGLMNMPEDGQKTGAPCAAVKIVEKLTTYTLDLIPQSNRL